MINSLSGRIFIGLLLGFLTGTLVQYSLYNINPELFDFILSKFKGFGSMFVNCIMLTVAPLVFFSITLGVLELKDISSFKRLSLKTCILYLLNTVFAICCAASVVYFFDLGSGLDFKFEASTNFLQQRNMPSFFDVVTNIVPSNVVSAFADSNMLQIIFLAILLGVVINSLGEKAAPAVKFFSLGNDIMIRTILIVMKLAPFGVFFLMVNLGATFDLKMIVGVLQYIGLIFLLLSIWLVVVYPLAAYFFAGVNPLVFLRAIREQFLFSITTASSSATIPLTMKALIDKLQVDRTVAGFGVPLGATVNMGGVSIYITVSIIFLINVFGIEINSSNLLALLFNVFFLAVGSGGVPGGGLVMIAVLVQQLGLPPEAFALIAAVDRIIDMAVTSVNVVGDTAVVLIVDRNEKKNNVKTASIASSS